MKLTLLGASGHAKVVAAAAIAAGCDIACLVDDDHERWGRTVLGAPVVGPLAEQISTVTGPALLAIGSNALRREWAERFAFLDWHSVVHPRAWVHASARVSPGTVIFAGAVVQPDACIGRHVIVNTGATVDHDCVLGDYVHIAPGVHLAGYVSVGEGAFLGVGASVIPRITIGEWALVGAGAVVTRDVPAGATVVGVPARRIR